jgi:hypothetical protein
LPALNFAERDRIEQRLSPDEETAVIEATRELLADAAAPIGRLHPPPAPPVDPPPPGPREPLRVLGYATSGTADELALTMLAHLLDDLPISLEVTGTHLQASQLLSLVQERGVSIVCLAEVRGAAPLTPHRGLRQAEEARSCPRPKEWRQTRRELYCARIAHIVSACTT